MLICSNCTVQLLIYRPILDNIHIKYIYPLDNVNVGNVEIPVLTFNASFVSIWLYTIVVQEVVNISVLTTFESKKETQTGLVNQQ